MHKRSIHQSIMRLHSGLANFYYHKAIYTFGSDLITIFVPIYFLTLQFSLLEVLLWLVVYRFAQPLSLSASSKLANRIGMRSMLIFTMLLMPVYFLMIWQIAFFPLLFFPAALFWSFTHSAYWAQELTLFLEVAKSRKAGLERGGITSIQNVFALFSPVIGGVILTLYGMPLLVALTGAALLLSMIPLFFIKKAHFRLRIRRHERTKKHRLEGKTVIHLLHRGLQSDAVYTFLPIFLFLLGLEIIEVGVIGSILAVMGIVTPLLIGKAVDKNWELVVTMSSVFALLTWVVLALFPERIMLFVLSIIIGLLYQGHWLSMNKLVCIAGKRKDPSFFGTSFELLDDIGGGINVFIMLVSYLLWGIPGMMLAIAGAGAVFLAWNFLSRKGSRS